MRRVVRRVVTGAVPLILFTGRVAAHDPPDTRFDAPIPLTLLFLGAAAAVGLTAVVLSVGTPTATRTHDSDVGTPATRGDGLVRVSSTALSGLTRLAGVGFLALVGFALVAAVFGPQEGNVATPLVWAVWFKGVGLFAALFGSPWSVISPWETVSRGLARLRPGGTEGPLAYPSWLGHWPALVGIVVVVGVVENLTTIPDVPRETALLVGGYALGSLAGGLLFGPVWFRRADFFDLLYRLFGRVAPLSFERDDAAAVLRVRPPWRTCADPVASPVVAAAVVAAVYIVSFDGFLNTIQYEYLLVDVGVAIGTGVGVELVVFLGGYLLFLVGFVTIALASDLLGGQREDESVVTAFAPTILPIAVAYEIAHTYPFVVRGVADVTAALVDVTLADPLGWLSLPAFWGSQVVLITVGHVVAVVASHRVTERRYSTDRAARRAHLPLTVLMIGYTVLSLWIISLPVVR